MEDSESKTSMMVLQDWVPGEQTCPQWLQQALYYLVCKSLPGSSLADYYEVYILSHTLPEFPIGLF
jgi:hypothetical protein